MNKRIIVILAIVLVVGFGGIGLITTGGDPSAKPTNPITAILEYLRPQNSSRLTADTFVPDFEGVFKKKSSAETDIFSAVIEYSPSSQAVTQKGLRKSKGDILLYQREKPVSSTNAFVYKVQVVSKEGVLLQQGWKTIPLEAIQTKSNSYRLQINTVYKKNAVVSVALVDNTVIWNGVMP